MTRRPFPPHHEFFRALIAADKARRRGDYAASAQHMKHVEAQLMIAERTHKLALLQKEEANLRDRQDLFLMEITDARYELWAKRRREEIAAYAKTSGAHGGGKTDPGAELGG